MNKAVWFLVLMIVGVSCNSGKVNTEGMSQEDVVKLKRQVAEGRRLFKLHCINCHQADGKGLGKLYPPVANSDFLQSNPELSICIIKNGYKKPIKVNDVEYHMLMPANQRLTNLEIAEIMSFLYTELNNQPRLFTPNQVGEILQECEK